MRLYVVVARAHASAIFYPGEFFSTDFAYTDRERCRLVFQTRYLDAGYDARVPTDLWVDIRGNAPDLPNAVQTFTNAATEISNIIVLGVNATMGRLELELVFDASPDETNHEFLQSFMPDRPLFPFSSRKIDVQAIDALIRAVSSHAERARIMRAIAQYTEGLRSWRVGNEIPCLAHLYMGVEAISKAIARCYCKKINKTEQEVAVEWGVTDGTKLQRRRELESEYRRRLVFQEDTDTYKAARTVSDSFEHGFEDFGKIHKPAREVIVKTAAYLRQSVIDLLDLHESVRARLFSDDYNVAMGPLILLSFLRGELVGAASQLAAEGQQYPILTWRSKLKNVSMGADGKYGFEPEEYITANIGANVQFRPQRYEMWEGSVLVQQKYPVPSQVIDPAVIRERPKNTFRSRIAAYIYNVLLWCAAKLDGQRQPRRGD